MALRNQASFGLAALARDTIRKPRSAKRVRALVAVGLAGAVAGCALGDDESMSALLVSPGKYQLYRCEDLAMRGKERVARVEELRRLMDKSAQGPGGGVANALAYRNEYLTAVGDLKELEKAALERKCEISWRPVSDRAMW